MLLPFGILLAQESPGVVTEVDYFNATRYAGGRNIARTANGNVAVVFEPAAAYTNGSQDIHYVVYNSAFKSWEVAKLSNSVDNATGIPAIVAHPTQEYLYTAWKEKNSNGDRDAMFSKITFIDAFTHNLSKPIVADNINNNAGVTTIDIASDGTLFNMFSIWNSPAIYDANIYSSRSTDDGVTWQTYNLTETFPTPNSLPINYMDVNLAAGVDGDMYAAWEDKATEITNEYEILFSKYSKSADKWSKPEIISPTFDGTSAVHKWVDGCTPTANAVSVYQMGPAGYALEGKSTVIYNDNGTSKVLSSFFNPVHFKPEADKNTFVADVVSFFGVGSTDSVLLVDDDNRFNNESVMISALDAAGIAYKVHDCGNVGGLPDKLPTAAQMSKYAMVIWYSGSDGVNIAFWNSAEEDNPELISYLSKSGSKLWVIGEDILYDRYQGAPDTFSKGDFCYDYLGIASYDGQSQADAPGLTQLDKVANSAVEVSSITTIGWGKGSIRQGEPTLATDPSGDLHMAYLDAAGDHIMYRNYKAGSWSTPVQVDDTPDTVNVQRPSIAVDSNYGIYVTWMEATHRDSVDDKSWLVYNVKYATSPDAGQNWNAPVQLSNATDANSDSYSIKNPTVGKRVRKELTGVHKGGADVVWTEYSEKSSMGFYIMYGRIPYVGTQANSIGTKPNGVAYGFGLQNTYPNPFNPATTLTFEVDKSQMVTLDIYNTLGQRVARLLQEHMAAGKHTKKWNAVGMPSGIYYAKLEAESGSSVKKMMLIK